MNCEQNQPPAVPLLCANNCGFYGNPSNNNLCSKCYSEVMRKQKAESNSLGSASLSTLSNNNAGSSSASAKTDDTRTESNQKVVIQSQTPACSAADAAKASATSPFTPSEQEKAESTTVLEKEDSSAVSQLVSPITPLTKTFENSIDSSSSLSPEQEETGSNNAKQTNKSRCWACNAKIGLVGFQCRCGFHFCGKHRYAESHNCTFDYKTFDRQNLTKHNYKVVADKIHKI